MLVGASRYVAAKINCTRMLCVYPNCLHGTNPPMQAPMCTSRNGWLLNLRDLQLQRSNFDFQRRIEIGKSLGRRSIACDVFADRILPLVGHRPATNITYHVPICHGMNWIGLKWAKQTRKRKENNERKKERKRKSRLATVYCELHSTAECASTHATVNHPLIFCVWFVPWPFSLCCFFFFTFLPARSNQQFVPHWFVAVTDFCLRTKCHLCLSNNTIMSYLGCISWAEIWCIAIVCSLRVSTIKTWLSRIM